MPNYIAAAVTLLCIDRPGKRHIKYKKIVFLPLLMQILEAKSYLTDFSVTGTPLGLFTLKTQYGYDLKFLEGGQYLFSCVSASDIIFFNDSEIKYACDVAFMLNSEQQPTVQELLDLAEGARDEMNRVLDRKLEEHNLGVMQIARLNIEETETMLKLALEHGKLNNN